MRSQPWYFILTLSLILVFVPTQVVFADGSVAADQNHTALLLTNLMAFLLPLGLILLAVGAASEERAVDVAVAGLLSWGLAVLGYFVCGFALQFGGVGLLSEMEGLSLLTAEWSPLDLSWGAGWGLVGLRGFALNADASTLGAYLLFFSQLPLVVTAVLIPVLSLVGRVRRSALLAIALLISAVVYPIVGNWIWGGGWLSSLGRTVGLGHGTVDFLGSGTVHLLGGMTALIGIVVFRLHKPESALSEVASMPPVHFPLFMIIGALLAALGWMASAVGNPLVPADIPIVVVMVNLLFAAVGGTLTALFYAWFTTTRPDALMGARGAIAGLVAASASCAFIGPWSALAIGGVAGVLLPLMLYLTDRVLRLNDPSAALAVHGFSGAWGLLSLAIFADGRYGAGWNLVGEGSYLGKVGQGVTGYLSLAGYEPDAPGQLYAQLIGLVAILIFAGALCWGLLALLRWFYRLPTIVREEAARLRAEAMEKQAREDDLADEPVDEELLEEGEEDLVRRPSSNEEESVRKPSSSEEESVRKPSSNEEDAVRRHSPSVGAPSGDEHDAEA
ncbi:MAG: hypothetical protein ABIK79_00575 [Chloroflexota bacterium]